MQLINAGMEIETLFQPILINMERTLNIIREEISKLESELKRAFDSGKSFYEKKEILQHIHSLQKEIDNLADSPDLTKSKPIGQH